MNLSFEKSPRPWRQRSWAVPREEGPWSAPATPEDLEALREALRRTAAIEHGRSERLMGHVLPQRLAEIDHLIAVHVCGYEFRPEGGRDRSDWDTSCAWRTGLGTFSHDATMKWTTDVDLAAGLMFRYVPKLRIDLRFGGGGHGTIRKARFGRGHPDPALAGAAVPLPPEWPPGVRRYPAIAMIDVFLTAFAMQKRSAESTMGRRVPDAAGEVRP